MLLQQVLLVIIFGFPEFFVRQNFGGDFACDCLLGLGEGRFGLGLLLLVVVEDGRHVLARALDGGVVVLPEHAEQLVVRRHLRIVVQIDCLGVVAQTVVARPVLGAPGVADPSPDDAWSTAELGLRKPKSGHPEGGLLGLHAGLEQGHGWCTKIANLLTRNSVGKAA